MTTYRFKLTALLIILCLPLHTTAGLLHFLNNDVLENFNASEVKSFKKAINETLNNEPDKKVIIWRSKTSTLNGKILPKISYEVNGKLCRRTLFLLSEGNKRKGHYRFDICKTDEQWTVMHSPINRFSKSEMSDLQQLLDNALNNQHSDHPIAWHNTKSGNAAVITALAPNKNGCRKAAISLITKNGDTSNGTYLFCKKDNKWQRELFD